MSAVSPPPPSNKTGGISFALGAYGLWGILPFYLLLVRHVPAWELVGWRAVFTLPVCLLFVIVTRKSKELLRAISAPRILAPLVLSAVLIGNNWLVYIWATLNGHVLAASLGYYINPLLNVLIGTTFLGERLSRPQWVAVALAVCGVAILAGGALTTLWISMVLALSFATYGVVRKLVPVGALVGLTVESLILLPPGIVLIMIEAQHTGQTALSYGLGFFSLIALSGVLTAVPLYLFSEAARRMDYSTLGFVQFLTPTIVFIAGLTVYAEPLHPAQFASFIAIWSAIAVFCWDLWNRRSKAAGKS